MSIDCVQGSDEIRLVLTLHFMGAMSVDEVDDLFRRGSAPWSREKVRRVLRGLLANKLAVRRAGQVYALSESGAGLAVTILDHRRS